MIYIEMARDEIHGAGSWSFSNCIWAPTKTKNGRAWPFWTKIGEVQKGDVVLHLRGAPPDAGFVGYSTVSENGFETSQRPPAPGEWGYADRFYRADLSHFTAFDQPVNVRNLFAARQRELVAYFEKNKQRKKEKRNLFYVKQGGRLQCQNGAYLSEAEGELLTALFGDGEPIVAPRTKQPAMSVATGTQLAQIQRRVGQGDFSREVKRLYQYRCCFPGCAVADTRFLVGAHIARWGDNKKLRGHMGNGLCLCLMHDKAFETGMFTLDKNSRVFVNPKEKDSSIWRDLMRHHGQTIVLAEGVTLLEEALHEHWQRIGIKPIFPRR